MAITKPEDRKSRVTGNSNPKRNKREKKIKSKDKNGSEKAKTSAFNSAAICRPHGIPENETLWQTFTNHPLVMISPFVLVPAIVYYVFYYFLLQHPELISSATFGIIPLRPAVRVTDERQVLVLGSLGSGTLQLATKLNQIFYMEIKHESVNAETDFVRDGTVSSLLGIRYAPRNVENHLAARMIDSLCVNRTKGSAAGFKPKHYVPSNCSSISFTFKKWTKCNTAECLMYLKDEWGCALHGTCLTPFRRVLHMVQHPIRTLQELQAKACPGNAKTVHPVFRQYATVFFDDTTWTSCLEALAWYVVNFHQAMIAARKQGLIHDSFQSEKESLCGIVRRAGFLDASRVVYEPNVEKLGKLCDEDGKGEMHIPYHTVTTTVDKSRPLPTITWDDLEKAGGVRLVKAFKDLCKDLGYDLNLDQLGEQEFEDVASGRAAAHVDQSTKSKDEFPTKSTTEGEL